MPFLTDWLPRKAILDAGQRQALPDTLRQWLNFALTQRGIDPRWITPVVEAVGTHLPEFRAALTTTPPGVGPRKSWPLSPAAASTSPTGKPSMSPSAH